MRYLLLSVLVIFIIGFFVVEDAFGIQYARVNIQPDSGTPECAETDSCYSPNSLVVPPGQWVKWKNLDTTAHTITSGTPGNGPDGVWDSSLIMSGDTFSYEFTQVGPYTAPYFCMVHPWMQGNIMVTGSGDLSSTISARPATSEEEYDAKVEARKVTSLTLEPSSGKTVDGDTVNFSGRLMTKNQQHAQFAFLYLIVGDDKFKLKTNASGFFSKTVEFQSAGNYRVWVEYSDPVFSFITAKSGVSNITIIDGATYWDLPPGVIADASSFQYATGWEIGELYKKMGNPKKDYAQSWSNEYTAFSSQNKKIIRGDGKDLLVFDLLIENKGTTPSDGSLRDLFMFDGKDREFSPIVSTALIPFTGEVENPGFSWREDCPDNPYMTIQPGIKGKLKVCFEIPKNADHFKVAGKGQIALVFDRASIGGDSGNTGGSSGGGCLIATAAFGSELAPQVQFLRELRDNTVLQTESGTSFMAGFNQFYYSFSPAIADYERENPAFKEAVKITLTPLLTSLSLLQYADIDSESEMLGYGIGVILLNIGMYFVAPAVLIMKIRKRI